MRLVDGFTVGKTMGIVHAKVLIIDKYEAVVGSNNLSRNAKVRNREVGYHITFNYPAVHKARKEFQLIYQERDFNGRDLAADPGSW